MSRLCPVCGPADAPRPTGTQTYVYGDVTHKTRECAAISAIGQTPIRGKVGYGAESGVRVCSDDCFNYGHPHAEGPDNKHWNPDSHKWQARDEDGRFID